MLDRSKERSTALARELMERYPVKVEHITLDLEDIERVRTVAAELSERQIDCLILNAGAYSIARHRCSSGFDNVFQINFLSPYLLARSLLPSIGARGGKVVLVGSIAHNYSRTDPQDIDFSERRAASKVYGNAKRYLMYSLMGLGGVSITHPGIAVTGITAHYPKAVYALIKHPMKLIFMSPKKAALSVLEGVFSSTGEGEWIGPRVFNVWGLPKRQRLDTCRTAERKQIKDTAERLYEKFK